MQDLTANSHPLNLDKPLHFFVAEFPRLSHGVVVPVQMVSWSCWDNQMSSKDIFGEKGGGQLWADPLFPNQHAYLNQPGSLKLMPGAHPQIF